MEEKEEKEEVDREEDRIREGWQVVEIEWRMTSGRNRMVDDPLSTKKTHAKNQFQIFFLFVLLPILPPLFLLYSFFILLLDPILIFFFVLISSPPSLSLFFPFP